MRQHRKYWQCSTRHQMRRFFTDEEYIHHLHDVHGTNISDTYLRILVNMNARKMVKLFSACPLCGEDEAEVGVLLEDHIAGHLRSLALISLPIPQDEMLDNAGSGKGSVDSSQPHTSSTVKDLSADEDMSRSGSYYSSDGGIHQTTDVYDTDIILDARMDFPTSFEISETVRLGLGNNIDDDPIIQSMEEQLSMQAVEAFETSFGADRPGTTTMMQNLANRSKDQVRWILFEEVESQVMGTSKTRAVTPPQQQQTHSAPSQSSALVVENSSQVSKRFPPTICYQDPKHSIPLMS